MGRGAAAQSFDKPQYFLARKLARAQHNQRHSQVCWYESRGAPQPFNRVNLVSHHFIQFEPFSDKHHLPHTFSPMSNLPNSVSRGPPLGYQQSGLQNCTNLTLTHLSIVRSRLGVLSRNNPTIRGKTSAWLKYKHVECECAARDLTMVKTCGIWERRRAV